MKFKDLTQEQVEIARIIYHDKTLQWDDRMNLLKDFFGKSERTVRIWCSEKLKFKDKEEAEPEQYLKAKTRKHNKDKKRFIITWGQSDTSVHTQFLANMEAFAEFINADIHVIAGRYKNPTSLSASEHVKKTEEWDSLLLPYLDANRHNIHKYVSIMSDIKIQPTAVNPMSGLQGVSGVNSCVFGAPKVQFEMIPILMGNKPKAMLTTGAVTRMNYTDSKSGKKGEFHHTYGFVIIEIEDGEVFHFRQVTADDRTGTFNDLYYHVENGVVSLNKSIEAIILGDVHYGDHEEMVLENTHKLLKKLVPNNVVLHDIFNGTSINHHEEKDPFIQYEKEVHGTNDLKKEINYMLERLTDFEKYKKVVIVRSNHDDFIDRWLKNGDWKKQPTAKNSEMYMELSSMLLRQHREKDVRGVIPEIIKNNFKNFVTLRLNESYKVKNWELGHHGDRGTNGSRGSLIQFRTLNSKVIVGHYHTPGRKDGALSVGTSTKLRLSYNDGASSWFNSHVIIHNDGRAQHINFVFDKNGEMSFTTFK